MKLENKRIAVLMGGVSNEREVSLVSGNAVLKCLKEEEKLQAVGIDVVDEDGSKLAQILKKEIIDIVFIALHGRYGEDGGIQGFLEKLSIPYTGSGAAASAVCFNKYTAKQLLESGGVSTPSFLLFTGKDCRKEEILRFGFPVVVKPCSGGSAIGISIAGDSASLEKAVMQAFEYDDCIIVEKYIRGREVTVSLLEDPDVRVLPIIEIVPKGQFYDYRAKYEPGMSRHILPARLSGEVKKNVEESGVLAYSILGCRAFARVDMIVSEKDVPQVLDINTIPGLTPTSLFPESARAAGISLGKLCRKLLERACRE